MKSLHFLCKVLSREENGTFKILVNLDNMNDFPIGNVGEKIVVSVQDLKKNDVLYIYDAVLDEETRRVTINNFTVLETTESDGEEIPTELLTLANLSEITPYDMLNEVYALEEIEDEDDEESKLSDTEDEEGSPRTDIFGC